MPHIIWHSFPQHALLHLPHRIARQPGHHHGTFFHAEPLNSHRLMLRALTQMRRLSPDNLRHFLAQMEALLWVEDAVVRLPKPAAKGKGSAGRVVKRKA